MFSVNSRGNGGSCAVFSERALRLEIEQRNVARLLNLDVRQRAVPPDGELDLHLPGAPWFWFQLRLIRSTIWFR